MRYALALLLVVVACSETASQVDAGLVGSWELSVPNTEGVARWVWDIHGDGSYAFHAEGPGGTPSHSGTFAAKRGHYQLKSTTIAWADTGTYQLTDANTLSATGKLGTASWHRVQAQARAQSDSSTTRSPDVASVDSSAPPENHPGYLPADYIYSYLSKETLDERALSEHFKATRSYTVDLEPQEKKDGMIGIVGTDVVGADGPGEVIIEIFRDRAAAKAAYSIYAVFDAKTFRSKPGELFSSHAFTYHQRGQERCLSRVMVASSTEAAVRCYLLVQNPTQDPVILVSAVSEPRTPGSNEASAATVQRGNYLMLTAIREWEIKLAEMEDARPK